MRGRPHTKAETGIGTPRGWQGPVACWPPGLKGRARQALPEPVGWAAASPELQRDAALHHLLILLTALHRDWRPRGPGWCRHQEESVPRTRAGLASRPCDL